MAHPALFLDRDGIFNELVFRDKSFHSPRSWDEVIHFSLAGLPQIKSLGFKLIMITNQPDIERKIISQKFVEELHDFYQKQYQLDRIYVCPYASNEHPLKKPNPGLFLLAQKELDLDLSTSFLLGDTEKDTLAAKKCGISSILWIREYNQNVQSDFRITSIKELMTILSQRSNFIQRKL